MNRLLLENKNKDVIGLIERSPKENIEIINAKDGNKTLKYNSKFLHSSYKPKEEAKKITDKLNLEKKDLIFIFGIGLAYILDEIIEKKKIKTKIVIIEPSLAMIDFFSEMKEEYLKRDDILIFHPSQREEILKAMEVVFKIGYSVDYELIKNNVSQKIFSEEYDLFIEIIRDIVSFQLVHTFTMFSFSKTWHQNSFRNLKYMLESYSVKSYFNLFKDRAAIVVSAGPSLDKNVKYLHWIKGKAPIIAVGTAVKKLMSENIEPDFIISMDGGEPNWEHFKNIDYSKIPLVYEPIISPKILKYHNGKKICFVSKNIVANWVEGVTSKQGEVKLGGSVALSGYDFAVKLGANPVVLIGQDLAYSYGQTHSVGTFYEDDKIKKDRIQLKKIEDIYGREVESDLKFTSFLKSFNLFIKENKEENKKLTVIDATEGGAKIKGSKTISLRAVYAKYIKNEKDNVHELIESIKFDKDINKLSVKFKESLNKLKKENKDFLDIVDRGVKTVIEIKDKKQYERLKDLDLIDEEIKKSYEISFMLNFLAQKTIAKVMNENRYIENIEESLLKTEKLYTGLKEFATFNLKCIEEIS